MTSDDTTGIFGAVLILIGCVAYIVTFFWKDPDGRT